MSIFKKRSIEEIKQPQEYYCSNPTCLNEIAKFDPLSDLLTRDAWENLADSFCVECIVERRY